MFDQEFIDKYWSRVDKSGGDDACWLLWSRHREYLVLYPQQLKVNGRWPYHYQVAYMIANGPIPTGLVVRHRCGRDACCNPRHLTIGTHRQNRWDWAARYYMGIEPGEIATYDDIPEWSPPA
jgi:hypothetical protein